MTGKTCKVCGKNTPYTDWDRCEKHNSVEFKVQELLDSGKATLVKITYEPQDPATARKGFWPDKKTTNG